MPEGETEAVAMVNATENIVIFNLRYDSSMRRDVLIPTNISGVTLYRADGFSYSAFGADNRQHSTSCKIRIPLTATVEDGRNYINEDEYEKLDDDSAAGYWTLQKGCYILIGRQLYSKDKWLWDPFSFVDGVITDEEIADMQALSGLDCGFITVNDYSDNTKRGSDSVKHWRIGGA